MGTFFNKEKWVRRDSNIELMRIFCLTMIVIHHMIIDSLYSVPLILENEGPVDSMLGCAILLNGGCYIAVNCFILISGYYGIRFKIKGLLKLYVICSFYVVIRFFFAETQEFDKYTFLNILFPFSYTRKWFITSYVILYLLSPIVNKAIDNLNKHEYILILVTLSIANIYFGYIWKCYNFNGYCVPQFIYLYIIGGYLKRFVNISNITKSVAWFCYLGCTILFGLLSIVTHYVHIPIYRSFAYNNPLMILGAVSFFIGFLKIQIKNDYCVYINWLASGTLAIYLAPEMPWRSSLSDYIIIRNNLLILIFVCIVYAFSKSIVILLFDKIRYSLIEIPVLKLFDKLCKNVSLLH